MKKYVIIGADSMLNDIFDIIHDQGHKVSAIFQNMKEPPVKKGPTIKERIALLGYPVEVFENLDSFSPKPGYCYVQGLTSVQKYKMIEELKAKFEIRFESLIHPEVYIGSNVKIGEGVFINAKATIAPNAHLDDFCSINRSVVVGHDAYVGKYTRLGPSVSLAGSTSIGNFCSIGISSTILDYVDIGEWSVIGAGAVVTKDIPEGKVAFGIPARVIKDNETRDFSKYVKMRWKN
jgi:sugar O-acyltransferase (sialic acid O-acetyltransferase NeuD family)